MSVPTPTIEYRFWGSDAPPDGEGIVGDGPQLYNVREVSARMDPKGEFVVWASGRMRRKDGQPGPSRSIQVWPEHPQPPWLEAVIDDASDRLLTPPASGSRDGER